MKLTDTHNKLFGAQIILSREIYGVEWYVFSNRVHYIRIPDHAIMTMNLVMEIRRSIETEINIEGYQYCNVIEFMTSAGMEPEVREWAAEPENADGSIFDAIIVKSMGHKLVANFYLNINRPKRKTKFFNSLENAVQWSKEQMSQIQCLTSEDKLI